MALAVGYAGGSRKATQAGCSCQRMHKKRAREGVEGMRDDRGAEGDGRAPDFPGEKRNAPGGKAARRKHLAGAEGLEPPAPVLETGRLPINGRPYAVLFRVYGFGPLAATRRGGGQEE